MLNTKSKNVKDHGQRYIWNQGENLYYLHIAIYFLFFILFLNICINKK